MATIAEALTLAVQHHQAGRFPQAEALYREILGVQPKHAEALHLLGALALQRQQPQTAIELIERALAIDPQVAAYHNTLGGAYQGAGQLDRALSHFQQAVQLNPRDAKSHFDLGNVLKLLERPEEAVGCLQQALDLQPTFLEAMHNLGSLLSSLLRFPEAVALFQQALTSRPNYALAHNSLGNTLQKLGRHQEAVASYRRAIQCRPNDASFHNNLGTALKAMGYIDEARACFQQALQLNPHGAGIHKNLGNAYTVKRQFEEALAEYRQAMELAPEDAAACNFAGNIYEIQGNLDQARAVFQKARQLNPHPEPWWELRFATLWPAIFQNRDEIDRYRDKLRTTLHGLSEQGVCLDPSDLPEFANMPPFSLLSQGKNDRPLKEAFGRLFPCPAAPPAKNTGTPRIGFVVTRGHEGVFIRLLGGILENIQPGLFELVVICAHAGIPHLKAQINTPRLTFLPIQEPLAQIVETVRAANFDLLYFWEVGTDVTNYFLPFFRLAPVQLTTWGVQETSGIPSMDYYLSSEHLEGENSDAHYSERLLRAKSLLFHQRRVALPAAPKGRQDFGLSAEQHIYLCAQRPNKFHPDFDEILAGILRRDERGVVVITESDFIHDAGHLKKRFAASIADVAPRIRFQPQLPYPEYLGLIAAADVLLDPLYYAGMNTTYDALSLNQPIVTLPSELQVSRFTFGCYRKMGVSDCIVENAEQYISRAVALGADAEYREGVRARIRETSEVLFEEEQAVREHEQILEALVRQARGGPAPPL